MLGQCVVEEASRHLGFCLLRKANGGMSDLLQLEVHLSQFACLLDAGSTKSKPVESECSVSVVVSTESGINPVKLSSSQGQCRPPQRQS